MGSKLTPEVNEDHERLRRLLPPDIAERLIQALEEVAEAQRRLQEALDRSSNSR